MVNTQLGVPPPSPFIDQLYFGLSLLIYPSSIFFLHKSAFLERTSLFVSILPHINQYYYLFKKFLVSDWLTANCEIVINSMANQIWIFHIHISKMTSKSQYEKNLDAFAPYYYDDENHIDSLTPLI